MTGQYHLLGCRGCGSVIVEAALRLADIAYSYEEVAYDTPGPGQDRLLALNPLCQVPTLVMPDGGVMTESAAIVLMIDDLAPAAGLAPRPGDPQRAEFLRWLIFLVAAIYPTFTYGDKAKTWLPDAEDAAALKAATDRHREALWRQVENAVNPDPHLLGKRFSALDLYVAAMVHWRPGRRWFQAECPRILGAADAALRDPRLAKLFGEQFD